MVRRRFKDGSGALSRRCRVSQARTLNVVHRACSDWSEIFGRPCPAFEWSGGSCGSLASHVKKFLSEPTVSPLQDEQLAFQSIKKLLPPSCECQTHGLLKAVAEKLSSPPRRLPVGYLSFVKKLSSQFFYKGWDSAYEGFCLTASPPIKSTIESTSRQGGSLGMSPDQSLFLDAVLGRSSYRARTDGQLIVVQSAGKPRPLSKFSFESVLLKPLHDTLYGRISDSSWLCRGDPTGAKLRKAGFSLKEGVLVSGDYKSATDNLPVEVAEEILRCARANSVFVPNSVWEHALSSLRPHLWSLSDDLSIQVSTGQMMGSFLSFPLLCFQNYLAFKWSCYTFGVRGRKLPLMINGDDILFQSSECFARHWMSVVGDLGLEVEQSKTSISESYGTLNSTLFEWIGTSLEVSPTPRLGMLRPVDFSVALGANFRAYLLGFRRELWFKAGFVFFKRHLYRLRESRLSLDELGFRGSLAWRIAKIFGLLPKDLVVVPAPLLPCPHNLHLPSGGAVSKVESGSLGPELERLNSLQMVSWKWGMDYSREQAALQYCLSLSRVRPLEGPDFVVFPRRYRLTPPSRSSLKRRFCRPLFDGPKMDIVFVEVLASQDLHDYEPLPPYSATEAELGVDQAKGLPISSGLDRKLVESMVYEE